MTSVARSSATCCRGLVLRHALLCPLGCRYVTTVDPRKIHSFCSASFAILLPVTDFISLTLGSVRHWMRSIHPARQQTTRRLPISQIGFQFFFCIALSDAPWESRNLCPESSFFRRVYDRLEFHGGIILDLDVCENSNFGQRRGLIYRYRKSYISG